MGWSVWKLPGTQEVPNKWSGLLLKLQIAPLDRVITRDTGAGLIHQEPSPGSWMSVM